jgi:hypothetical protein
LKLACALAIALAIVVGAGAPRTARAAGDEAAQQKAKARIKKARQYYEQQKFDQAIAEYTAAYKLVAAPDILFNIGQIFEVKGDPRRALQFYLKYVEVEPEGRLAGDARTRVEERTAELLPEELKARYAEALGKTTPEARASDPAWKELFAKVAAAGEGVEEAVAAVVPKPPPKPQQLHDKPAVAAVVEAPAPKPKRAPRPTPPILKKWWFWTAVGGGAAVILAIGLGAGLASGPTDPSPTLGVLR